MIRGAQKVTIVYREPSPVNDGNVRPIPRRGFPDLPGGITPAPTFGIQRSQSPATKNSGGMFKRMFAGLF